MSSPVYPCVVLKNDANDAAVQVSDDCNLLKEVISASSAQRGSASSPARIPYSQFTPEVKALKILRWHQ